MGVDLTNIIEKHEISFAQIQGRLAVDAYNTLYQFLTIIRQPDGTPLMDSRGRITSHLSGLFYRTCNLLEKGARPIFVFDGEPSELKRRTIEQRRERKRIAQEEFEAAKEKGESEEMRIYAQQTARLTREMVDEAKVLLKLMGVPVVDAESEGEAQCASMCAEGLVDATASQDLDALLFGTPTLIKNITLAGRRKLPRKNVYTEVVPEKIVLEENLERLGINRQKLIWIGILVGTDFDEGITGIGAKKGLKLAREHNSFPEILKAIKKEMDWEPVEELFLNPPANKVEAKDLQFQQPDQQKVINYMMDRSFSVDRVQNALNRAYKNPLDSKQGTLQKWF